MTTALDYFWWIDEKSDEVFRKKLIEHVQQGTDSWAPLLAPERVERVWRVLVDVKNEQGMVLADMDTERAKKQRDCFRKGPLGKQEWFDYEYDWNIRRKDKSRIIQLVELALSRIRPSRIAVRSARADSGQDSGQFREVIELLVRSIAQHKQSTEWNQIDASVADRALWSQLSRVKMPGRGDDISLREWLARMDSMPVGKSAKG